MVGIGIGGRVGIWLGLALRIEGQGGMGGQRVGWIIQYLPHLPILAIPMRQHLIRLFSLRMKVTHQKHAAEMSENRTAFKCDCRYKVMEAKAEVETHVAAGEKLKGEREKYKSLFHQYAKERKLVMERLQVRGHNRRKQYTESKNRT